MFGPHYNYTFMLFGESWVDKQFGIDTTNFAARWYPAAFVICALYMAGIKWGKAWMSSRPAYNLRGPLIVWNIFLSLFSVAGAVRNSPDFFAALRQEGFMHTICISDYVFFVTGWWSLLFTVSKVFELGDTVFLVLRKRPVIFLHWYHHVSVLLFTWHGFSEMAGPGRWFIAMNYIVHAVMYPYYLARVMGVRVPRLIPVSITLMQLGQMFIGCYICGTVLYLRLSGSASRSCQISDRNLAMAVVVYSSYLILFLNFFYHTYISRGVKAGPAKKEKVEPRSDKSHDAHDHSSSNGNAGDVRMTYDDVGQVANGAAAKDLDSIRDEVRQRSKSNGYHTHHMNGNI